MKKKPVGFLPLSQGWRMSLAISLEKMLQMKLTTIALTRKISSKREGWRDDKGGHGRFGSHKKSKGWSIQPKNQSEDSVGNETVAFLWENSRPSEIELRKAQLELEARKHNDMSQKLQQQQQQQMPFQQLQQQQQAEHFLKLFKRLDKKNSLSGVWCS